MAEQPAEPRPIQDPFTIIRRHASIIAEYYDAFEAEGFDEDQAFALTLAAQRAVLDIQVMKS